MSVEIESSWKKILEKEFDENYFISLMNFLKTAENQGRIIYPRKENIFKAFHHTPFTAVKVVIVGQDPYHGPGQAHGLSFSVKEGVRTPPSLRNIFKELAVEYSDFRKPDHGNLTKWAEQGVLLLNAVLTVEAGKAGSHQKKGWETFTNRVIQALSEKRTGIIFILWGSNAKTLEKLIDTSRHHILSSAHPSPLSARSGFFGNDHFKRTNEILIAEGQSPIDWQI